MIYGRCRTGLKVVTGRHAGLYIKKPSSMTASHPTLLVPFRNLKCKEDHEHLSGMSHSSELAKAQVWTWQEAKRVIDGITLLRQVVGKTYVAYPIDVTKVAQKTPGEPSAGLDSRAPTLKVNCKCKGCQNMRGRSDWEHNRKIGECQYPHDEPFIPTCEACIKRVNATDGRHDLSEGC